MVGNIPFFVSSIGGGVFFAILLAVINTMLLAAREQSQDVGILKALGFTRLSVFFLFLLQSLAVAVTGGALGIGLALLTSAPLARLLGTSFPNYGIAAETMVLAGVMCIAIGLLAGVLPALRLSRLSPVDALRTEV
jgi:putative ABC transport system permease protein